MFVGPFSALRSPLAKLPTAPHSPATPCGVCAVCLRFALYEPVEFIRHFLMDKLDFKKVRGKVTVHVPCTSKKMGIEASFAQLAGLCAEEVTLSNVPCCGTLRAAAAVAGIL